jgi:hypothetical protein
MSCSTVSHTVSSLEQGEEDSEGKWIWVTLNSQTLLILRQE